MGYFLTTSCRERAAAESLASPKTHTPGSRVSNLGARFYSPDLGRWVNRDPIEERGGVNLHGFCANNAVQRWDTLGLYWPWPATVNPSERAWCKRHPCCCLQAKDSGDDVRWVMGVRYVGWADNTVENSVQHCAWMCYVASMFWCSRSAALELGQAHENYAGNPPHDRAMDLHNNGVGVTIGETDLTRCFNRCEDRARAHRLYWWTPVGGTGPRRGLPSDFPGFTIDPSGTVSGGTVGSGSPTAPVFTSPTP